jgi:threonine dehydrogenase-like Zn-dependent dehydrogenase
MNFKGVPGHEFVGIVEKATDAKWINKRVVGEINAACGECEYCRKGLKRHCLRRTVLGIMGRNGAFAEFLTLPEVNLWEVPDKLDNHTAVFTEPLAAALEITEQVKIEPDWKVLIIGDGKLSALVAQVLKLKGVNLTVLGKIPSKLKLFEKWGIFVTLQIPEEISFDLVIEASGSSQGWITAIKLVKPRGTIVLKSTYQGEVNFNTAPLVINEITIIGSRCGPFAPALRILEMELVEVKPLISKVFSFENILEAFKYSQRPECLKVIIDFPPKS